VTKILIVDDDLQICKGLSEILDGEGYDTSYLQSGKEAIERIAKEDFDVVLVDLVMPGVDGMDVLAWVMREKPKIKVIMITAFATVENAVEAVKKGASDYIPKPFKSNEVETSIKRVLEEARFNEIREKGVKTVPLELSEDMQHILDTLANPIRRDVIELLSKSEKSSFTEIKEGLNIDDPTKLSFHLRKLKSAGILEQDSKRIYVLSERGRKAVEVLGQLEGLYYAKK
jgi:DNA-binding NtrC family response regulator